MIDIPNDAWRVVISYLSPESLYRLGLTSKRFQKLSSESPHWKYFCNRDFGGYRKNPYTTYLRCQRNTWRCVHKISGAGVINFLDFKDSEIISGSQARRKYQTIKTYSNFRLQSNLELRTAGRVLSIIRNNDTFITGSQKIEFWNLQGKFLYELDYHSHSISTLLQNNESLISGSYDHTICVWDVDRKTPQVLNGYDLPIRCLSLNENQLIGGGGDGNFAQSNLNLWDLRTNQKEASFEGANYTVTNVERWDNEIIYNHGSVWDIRTFKIVYQYPENFFASCFAPDRGKVLGLFDSCLCSYTKYQPPKILFTSPNYLTYMKRLGDRLLVGSTTHHNNKSIYFLDLENTIPQCTYL